MDKEQIQKKFDELKAKITYKKDLYTRVFNSPDGKEILQELEEIAFYNKGLNSNMQIGLPIDTNAMMINEGKRQLLQQIKNIINEDTEKLIAIAKYNLEQEKKWKGLI